MVMKTNARDATGKAQVYEHLNSSPNHRPTFLLRYLGRNEYRILLEYAHHSPIQHYPRKPTTADT